MLVRVPGDTTSGNNKRFQLEAELYNAFQYSMADLLRYFFHKLFNDFIIKP